MKLSKTPLQRNNNSNIVGLEIPIEKPSDETDCNNKQNSIDNETIHYFWYKGQLIKSKNKSYFKNKFLKQYKLQKD